MRFSLKPSILSVGLLLLALSSVPAQAAIIVVDDFTSDTLNASYQQSNVTSSGAATITYNTSDSAVYTPGSLSFPDKLTYSFTSTASSAATQSVLIRDDYKLLTDGDWVQITSNINSASATTGTNGGRLSGGLAMIVKGDTGYTNLYALYMRATKDLTSLRGTGLTTNTATTVTNLSSIALTDPVTYRFTRLSPTTLLSEYSTNWDPLTQTGTFTTAAASVTVPDFSTLGFGVFNGNATTSNTGTISFDNLTANIQSVPEPSTYLLGTLGLLGLGVLCKKTQR
jgi:hypothetical protein